MVRPCWLPLDARWRPQLKRNCSDRWCVDCGRAGDIGFDSFTWKVTITKQAAAEAVAGDDTGSGWNSAGEFAGPTPAPLSAWEKYAQVLLESNEFAFVD